MNSLKLYKSALIRVLLPLALAFAVLLVLFALNILRVGDMSDYFELVTIAATLAAAFFTVKEIFSLSVSCGASRKMSFAAISFSAVTTALIITAAHAVESLIFSVALKGAITFYDGTKGDFSYIEILQNYSLSSLSFSQSPAYIYLMLFLRTMLVFMSGTAFFIIMSRLETIGRIINLGVIMILFAANIGGEMFTPYLSAPVMSYDFFDSVFGNFSTPAFTIAYILLTIAAIALSFAFYRRKPIKYKRSV